MTYTRDSAPHIFRAVAGGILGGAVGYFGFKWILSMGFYAGLLPGAAVGIGCGLAAGIKSRALAAICGVAGLVFGIFVEWKFFPFIADDSFGYFLGHVFQVNSIHLLMLIGGGLLAAWFGFGRTTHTNTSDET